MYIKKIKLLNFCNKAQKTMNILNKLIVGNFIFYSHDLTSLLSRFFGFIRAYSNDALSHMSKYKIIGSNNYPTDCLHNSSSMVVLNFIHDHNKLNTLNQAG